LRENSDLVKKLKIKKMNINITLLAFYFLAMSAPADTNDYKTGPVGKKEYKIEVESVERQFIVYQPKGNFEKDYPVVFMFHGASGNGERFYNFSGWKEKADEEGIIAVFPTAIQYCVEKEGKRRQVTRWNEGSLETDACQGQQFKDDVLFFRKMVEFLEDNYKVDKNRIYASGFSNGASFVSRLTIEASDILAATAVVSGVLQDTSWETKNLIPSFLAIGQNESLLLDQEGNPLPLKEDALVGNELIMNVIFRMVDKLKLERNYDFYEGDSRVGFIFNESKVGANNEYRFALIENLPHKYPNGTNHPLVMADIFWDFFKDQHK
jgi:polyhydroxybutyrate depolymerase